MQEAFERLMDRFGVLDIVTWVGQDGWMRQRVYHDGAWLEGHRFDPINYFGA